MDKNYIKLTVSILLILLGTWLLFINEENPKISNRSMGDDSLVVIDLTKMKSLPRYVYIISGCLLIAIGAAYLIKPHLGQKKDNNDNPLDALSEREWTIVSLIEKGMTNKEIGGELHISLSTVKTHVNNIFKKLSINSRSDLLKITASNRV